MTRWAKPKPAQGMSLFDQHERKKQSGIEASYQYADSHWKAAAKQALMQLAIDGGEFTADDIWPILAKQGIHTHNNSALGAVIQGASRAGLITKTGGYKESTNPKNHSRPVSIWRSNIKEY